LGDLVLDLLTGSLAPTTYNNYGTGMRRFTVFRDEQGITPLEANVERGMHGSIRKTM
jgi:hypothetical protein